MRAMLLDEPGRPLRAADVPEPEPGPGELRIRVHACGVCRTDLHLRDGEIPAGHLPLVLGHQIVGTDESGRLLMRQVADIDWGDPAIAIPAFLTIVLMPFTFSITNGIGAGFLAYVAIKVFLGRWREPGVLLWVIAFLFLIYFAIDPVERLLGV